MTGKIIQVSGSVVEVLFPDLYLPRIREALTVETDTGTRVMEVALHVGEGRVRCILLAGSEGLRRGMTVTATGSQIKVPVGSCTLGRIFNVLGEPIDGGGAVPEDTERWPIHRKLLLLMNRVLPPRSWKRVSK